LNISEKNTKNLIHITNFGKVMTNIKESQKNTPGNTQKEYELGTLNR
jgi:hypothetical protein